ncbi:MAG: hypothetical protein GY719_33830 [bacterium]|nr:hypothetical protein [bacterium]
MSRRRSRGKKDRSLDPVAVLERRIEVRPEELFDLIHRVNPTGRELSRREEARRYAQKSRLQSLLIRRFGEEHVRIERGEQEGVVSLGHRSGARDACHAVLADLEPDARSWVQRRLDLEASPAETRQDRLPAEGLPGAGSVAVEDQITEASELLRLGLRAVEEFDYEAAEEHLKLAVEHGGGVAATLALLDLWVGTLGMDRRALRAEPRLGAEAKAHSGVRAFLALAAARLGEVERALELATGIAGPRAAEVHAALAARAIRDRDPEAAGRRLDAVREHDPTHPRIQGLADELAALTAESQRPAEEALEQRFQDEGFLAAEADARALLARWPESQVARRILRRVATHRHEEELARHLELGEQALAEGRFHEAAQRFQAALDEGSDRSDLPALIERSRRRERREREAARVASAVDRFAADDLRGALLGYLSLPETLRARVAGRVDHRALARLEQLGAPRGGAKAQAAVAAVLALEQAVDELRGGRARDALDALSPHRDTLAGVEEARECLGQARARVAAERRGRAHEALAAAREAATRSPKRAKTLLEDIDLDDLDGRDRTDAEDLLARIRRSEEVRRLEREVEGHIDARDFLGALDRARQLVELGAEPAERARWQRRVDELRGQVRDTWQIEVSDLEAPLEDLRDFDPDCFVDAPRTWLDDEGGRLVLASAWGDRLFVRVVDLDLRRVVASVSLRAPESLGRTLATCLDGDRLRIAGAKGGILELDTGSWEVRSWRLLGELLPSGSMVESSTLLPGGRYLWLQVRTAPSQWQTWVVDLRAWRVNRKLPAASLTLAIVGPGEPRVVLSGFKIDARLYSARGTAESSEPLMGRYIDAAAVSPGGGRLLLGFSRPEEKDEIEAAGARLYIENLEQEEDDASLMLVLAEESQGGGGFEPVSGLDPGDVSPEGAVFATSLDHGLSYALVLSGEGERELLTLAAPEETIDQLHRVEVPYNSVLVQDRRSRHVVALTAGADLLEILPLDNARPRVAAVDEPRSFEDRTLPHLGYPFLCGHPTGSTHAAVLALLAMWSEQSADELRQMIGTLERNAAGDADALVRLCLALGRREGLLDDRDRLVRRVAKNHPGHAGAALLMAELEAREGRWPEVERLLAGADPQDLEDDDGRASHFLHLLGIAHLRAGRREQALATFERAAAFERSDCRLQRLIDLTRPMSDPPEPHEWSSDQPLVRQILGVILVADRALAEGDAAAALAALDRPPVWHAAEVQSAARLAAAYLQTTTSNAGERFRKRLALAFYRHLYRGRERAFREMLFPGVTWDDARLAEVDESAGAWLGDS